MSKFTTAFREIGTYKELLRSQVGLQDSLLVYVLLFLPNGLCYMFCQLDVELWKWWIVLLMYLSNKLSKKAPLQKFAIIIFV